MALSARCISLCLAALAATGSAAGRGPKPAPDDNVELSRMFQEDQDDRQPGLHGIDWSVVKPRDDARTTTSWRTR